MELLALLIGAPYLAYLLILALFMGIAALYISGLTVWLTTRWVVLTLLYYLLWPFAWLQDKLHP